MSHLFLHVADMKKYSALIFLLFLVFIPSGNAATLKIIRIHDPRIYRTPNSLVVEEGVIRFINYGPITLEENAREGPRDMSDLRNGAWIEWRFSGVDVGEVYPSHKRIIELDNSSLSKCQKDGIIYDFSRGISSSEGITGCLGFEQGFPTMDYWDLTLWPTEPDSRLLNDTGYEDYVAQYPLINDTGKIFMRDLVHVSENTVTSSLFSNWIDHDSWSVNYTVLSSNPYVQPIFRNSGLYKNTYDSIFVGKQEYRNGSKIYLRGITAVDQPNPLTGNPIQEAQKSPVIQNDPSPITQEMGLLSTVVIASTASYSAINQKKPRFTLSRGLNSDDKKNSM